MDLFHQRLERAPADFAKVSFVVRQELLVTAGAVDVHMSPPKIVVGLAKTTITNEGGFLPHARD